jgi:hypothetical protein
VPRAAERGYVIVEQNWPHGLDSGLFKKKDLSAACERGRIIYFLDRSLEFIE